VPPLLGWVWEGRRLLLSAMSFLFTKLSETLRPRLLVILGSVALSSLETMGAILKERGTFKATIGRHTTAIHFSGHPYGDFNFTDQRRPTDALALRNAWDKAIQTFSQ